MTTAGRLTKAEEMKLWTKLEGAQNAKTFALAAWKDAQPPSPAFIERMDAEIAYCRGALGLPVVEGR